MVGYEALPMSSYAVQDLPATAVDDMPFHTSEIISDVMDDLLPLQEGAYMAGASRLSHFGDQARSEITNLLERLLGLFEQRNRAQADVSVSARFFDSALPRESLHNLMQCGFGKIEDLLEAFHNGDSGTLRYQAGKVKQLLESALQQLQMPEEDLHFIDPFHAYVKIPLEPHCIHFAGTVTTNPKWHLTEDFFFAP